MAGAGGGVTPLRSPHRQVSQCRRLFCKAARAPLQFSVFATSNIPPRLWSICLHLSGRTRRYCAFGRESNSKSSACPARSSCATQRRISNISFRGFLFGRLLQAIFVGNSGCRWFRSFRGERDIFDPALARKLHDHVYASGYSAIPKRPTKRFGPPCQAGRALRTPPVSPSPARRR